MHGISPTNNHQPRARPTGFPGILLWLTLLSLATPSLVTGQDRAEAVAVRITPRLKRELAEKKLAWGSPVHLRIFKESNELELWIRGEEKNGEYVLFRNYKICSWSGGLGPKQKQGDRQAPEGFYRVTTGRLNPNSRYHLSFDLGYPNAYDRAKKRTGDYLMVHGDCVSIGCYAMGDKNIEEIYTLVSTALLNGQKNVAVHCFPFRMVKARMDQEDVKQSQWLSFWLDLQPAYRSFENHWKPPSISVVNERYVVKDAE